MILNYNKQDYPIAQLVGNIKTVFDRATPAQIAQGSSWYIDANRYARIIAKETGYPLNIVCMVIAATSTRNKWYFDLDRAGNLNSAIKVLEAAKAGLKPADVTIPTFNQAKQKAFDIAYDYLAGKTEMEYFGAKYFSTAAKTWAFTHNILNPDSSDFVTIDGHAANLATSPDERLPLDVATSLSAKNRYEILETAYRQVAVETGLRAWQVQAITWETYRSMA